MHISNFAHKLKCKHCGEFQGSDKWPVNGDRIAFYIQKEPGNFYIELNCSNCKNNFYVVWDNDPGQIQPLTIIRERKSIHNSEAIKRKIKFKDSGAASVNCCWNCTNFSIVHGGRYWCREDMIEVNRSDLCSCWYGRTIYSSRKWWQFF